MKRYAPLFLLFFLSLSATENRLKGGYIKRKQCEALLPTLSQKKMDRPLYPWEVRWNRKHPIITKEHFRCKGSGLNEEISFDGQIYRDCSDGLRHTLPLRDGKEFIYPILTKLLNHIQDETGKRVVVTSGHRCPTHNTWVDPSKENQTSKHQIGAEVSFYVEGMEENPHAVINLILNHFPDSDFKRYDKSTNVSTPPWYNKEIFLKLFLPPEGRNRDNEHPFPYISIQVRHFEDERITYDWKSAHQNYSKK